MSTTKSISKILSSNDIGITGAHQAGILVPKQTEILSFFPKLDGTVLNPRALLEFYDNENSPWHFSFIYYNNSFFGGTRNEYRLTRMTKYLKANNLKAGDELLLTDHEGNRNISFRRQLLQSGRKVSLSNSWKVVKIKS